MPVRPQPKEALSELNDCRLMLQRVQRTDSRSIRARPCVDSHVRRTNKQQAKHRQRKCFCNIEPGPAFSGLAAPQLQYLGVRRGLELLFAAINRRPFSDVISRD